MLPRKRWWLHRTLLPTTVVLLLLPLGIPAAEELALGLVGAPEVQSGVVVLNFEDLEGVLVGEDPVLDAADMEQPMGQGVPLDDDRLFHFLAEDVVDGTQGAQNSQQSL